MAVPHGRGVKAYAVELVEGLDDSADLANEVMLAKALSERGAKLERILRGRCATLCHDVDIAERLCPPSELKRNRGNASAEWPGELVGSAGACAVAGAQGC